jgi:hypothetical protein
MINVHTYRLDHRPRCKIAGRGGGEDCKECTRTHSTHIVDGWGVGRCGATTHGLLYVALMRV